MKRDASLVDYDSQMPWTKNTSGCHRPAGWGNQTRKSACCEERAIVDDYGQRFRETDSTDVIAIERVVLGSDFGVTGYTTVAQADELIRRLRLGPAGRVLDIGAGCGWPGLYLSIKTGCRLVSTDLPIEGPVAALRRAGEEGIAARVSAAVCSARRLPFRRRSFDAIVHSDVMC